MKKRLCVIGGGPGGYVAAIRAAQLGMDVTLVEKSSLGGVCLNWGCIPTKALLAAAEHYESLAHLDTFGISVKGASFDLGKMVDHSRATSDKLCKGVAFLMKKNGINVIKGHAKLVKKGKKTAVDVQCEGNKEQIAADTIILATGARPSLLPNLEVDGKRVWTSKEAMLQRTLPKTLIVLGSGAIGLEFASFYRSLGSQVIVIERESRLLPVADSFISKQLLEDFKVRGIECLTGRRATQWQSVENGVQILLDNGKSVTAEALLLAIGVKGNIENLGLEDVGVQITKGRIAVDAYGRTSVSDVYAIGDVTDEPWLAHKASHEGILAVEHIAGKAPTSLSKNAIPACVYSNPQIASIGLTEEQAREKGYALQMGTFPFHANGKALAMGKQTGGVKTIFDKKTGALLGAHMIGYSVTELIATCSLTMVMEGTDEELAHTVFPHPTLSEMLHESVLSAQARGLHT